ncbi:MAG: hypothetical protein IID55_07045 [Proteobacteria bacterium]|nr:hypothetical protein [Pseudomonadota bacterium]
MAVTYELYVKQKGRWNFEAQFAGHLREAALAEAKELESHVQAAKVIREQTDAEGNVRESTIYNSERTKTGRLTAEQRNAAASRTPSAASRGYADIEVTVYDKPRNYADMEVDLGGGHDGAYSATRALNRRGAPGGVSNLMGPEAMVLTKLFLIVASSFAFAAFVTWLFLRTGLVAA